MCFPSFFGIFLSFCSIFLWILTFSSPLSSFSLQFHVFPIFLFFCFFVLFLEEVWRWEESSLKMKKLEGVEGEGAAPPPQMHWVLLHLFVLHVLFCSSVFFLVLMGRGVAVRGVSLKIKELEGGWGGGRSASPQMHWVLLHLFVLHFLFCSSVFS